MINFYMLSFVSKKTQNKEMYVLSIVNMANILRMLSLSLSLSLSHSSQHVHASRDHIFGWGVGICSFKQER